MSSLAPCNLLLSLRLYSLFQKTKISPFSRNIQLVDNNADLLLLIVRFLLISLYTS
jgi:hypothetical protein